MADTDETQSGTEEESTEEESVEDEGTEAPEGAGADDTAPKSAEDDTGQQDPSFWV